MDTQVLGSRDEGHLDTQRGEAYLLGQSMLYRSFVRSPVEHQLALCIA